MNQDKYGIYEIDEAIKLLNLPADNWEDWLRGVELFSTLITRDSSILRNPTFKESLKVLQPLLGNAIGSERGTLSSKSCKYLGYALPKCGMVVSGLSDYLINKIIVPKLKSTNKFITDNLHELGCVLIRNNISPNGAKTMLIIYQSSTNVLVKIITIKLLCALAVSDRFAKIIEPSMTIFNDVVKASLGAASQLEREEARILYALAYHTTMRSRLYEIDERHESKLRAAVFNVVDNTELLESIRFKLSRPVSPPESVIVAKPITSAIPPPTSIVAKPRYLQPTRSTPSVEPGMPRDSSRSAPPPQRASLPPKSSPYRYDDEDFLEPLQPSSSYATQPHMNISVPPPDEIPMVLNEATPVPDLVIVETLNHESILNECVDSLSMSVGSVKTQQALSVLISYVNNPLFENYLSQLFLTIFECLTSHSIDVQELSLLLLSDIVKSYSKQADVNLMRISYAIFKSFCSPSAAICKAADGVLGRISRYCDVDKIKQCIESNIKTSSSPVFFTGVLRLATKTMHRLSREETRDLLSDISSEIKEGLYADEGEVRLTVCNTLAAAHSIIGDDIYAYLDGIDAYKTRLISHHISRANKLRS